MGGGHLLATLTDEQWHTVIDVRLTGPFYVTRAIVPHMLEKSYGRIVNRTSSSTAESTEGVA
jgi:3-oxoacyl-[acyl-carrier protein] reductase